MFNPNIDLGHILQIVTVIGGGIVFIWTMKIHLEILNIKQASMQNDIGEIKVELQKLTEVAIQQVRHNTRLDVIESRITEIVNNITDLYSKRPPRK